MTPFLYLSHWKIKKKLSQNCKHFVGPDGIGRVHNGSMKCSLLSFCTRAHDTSLCRTSTPHRLSSSPRTLPATRRTGTSCAGRRTSPVGNIFQTFTLLLEWIATVKLLWEFIVLNSYTEWYQAFKKPNLHSIMFQYCNCMQISGYCIKLSDLLN